MNPRYSRFYTFVAPVIKNPILRSVAPYIFSIVTVTIFIVFAIRPTVSTILNLQKNIDNNQAILDSLNKKVRNLSQAKNNYNSIDRDLKVKIVTLIPPQPNVTTLVTSLQSSSGTASPSALQLQPLNLFDQAATGNINPNTLKEVDFSVNFQGAYSGLVSSLDRLLKSPRLISISGVNINKQASASAIMSVTGKAYFLP